MDTSQEKSVNGARVGRKPKPMPDPVTEGQRLLQMAFARDELTYEQVCAATGCRSPAAVMNWLRGEKRPAVDMRAQLAAVYGVPPGSWDVRAKPAGSPFPVTPEPAEAPPPPPPPGARPSTLDSCLAVLDTLRDARSTPGLLASEKIKIADSEGRMLALRARLEREAERGEDRIVREHPAWQRLKRLIVKTLSEHPAALKDLEAALGETLEGGDL